MYAHTFTKGKACMEWKIKVFVRGIRSRFLVRGIGLRFWSKVLVQGIRFEV